MEKNKIYKEFNQLCKPRCEKLIKQNWQSLWNLCFKLTLNRQECEFLLEEVLYRIVKYFDSYDMTRPFISWVWKIALNSLKTYKKNHLQDFAYIEKPMQECIPAKEQINTITSQYLSDKISKCLEILKPIERMVFCMKYFDDKKYYEIAELLQINENSARVYTMRAKEKLKKALGGWIYEM
jgi:RNA polymerase sigma-70 factor (ECF subfamily)